MTLKKNLKDKVSVNIFDLLAIMEKHEQIDVASTVTSYCDICGKKHFRQWYISKRADFSFYICTIEGKVMCKFRNGRWQNMELIDLIEKIL